MDREEALKILLFLVVLVICVLIAVRQILKNNSGGRRENARAFYGFGIGPSNQMLSDVLNKLSNKVDRQYFFELKSMIEYVDQKGNLNASDIRFVQDAFDRSVERPSLKMGIGSGWKSAKRPLELIVTYMAKNDGQNKVEVINDNRFNAHVTSTLRLRPGHYLMMYTVTGNYPFGVALVDEHSREKIAASVQATDDSAKFCWLQMQCHAGFEETKLEVSKSFLFQVPPGAIHDYHLILDSLFWTYIYTGNVSLIAVDTPTHFTYDQISWAPPLNRFDSAEVDVIVYFIRGEIKTVPFQYKWVKVVKEPNSWVYKEYLDNNTYASPIVSNDKIAITSKNSGGPVDYMPKKTYGHGASFLMLDKQSPIFGFRINGHGHRFQVAMDVKMKSNENYQVLLNLQSTKTGFELQIIFDDNRIKARMLLYAGGPVIWRTTPVLNHDFNLPDSTIKRVEVSIDDVLGDAVLNLRAGYQSAESVSINDQVAANDILKDFIPIDRVVVGGGTDIGNWATTCDISYLRIYSDSGYQWVTREPVDTSRRLIETVFSKSPPVIAIRNGTALIGSTELTPLGDNTARPRVEESFGTSYGVSFEAAKNTHYQIPAVSFAYKRGFTFVCMLVPRFGADVDDKQAVFEFAEGSNSYIRLLCDKGGFNLMFSSRFSGNNVDKRLAVGVNEKRIVIGRIGEMNASLELLTEESLGGQNEQYAVVASISQAHPGFDPYGVFNKNYIAKASTGFGKAGNFLLQHLYLYNYTLSAEEMSSLVSYMKDVTPAVGP